MFQNFYTTQMSGNAKSLQKRFSKIRAGKSKAARFMAMIMTVVILAATLGGAVVLAAIGEDGLEAQTKEEKYFVAALKSSVQVDLDQMPEWVKDISSNGKIDFQIDYLNIRRAKSVYRHSGGNITQLLTAKFKGDQGKAKVDKGLNASDACQTFSFSIISDDSKTFLLWCPLDEDKNIVSYSLCFTTPDSEYSQFAHTKEYKENFIPIEPDVIEYIGDFEGVLKKTDYFTMGDYFTFFEANYQNKRVEGIDIAVTSFDTNGLSVKLNISRNEPDTLAVCVRKREDILDCRSYVFTRIEEINNSEFRVDTTDPKWRWAFRTPEKPLIQGGDYVVDFVLLQTEEDENQRVVYRQREYVTIP